MCGQEVLRARLPATAKNGREQTTYSGVANGPRPHKRAQKINPPRKDAELEAAEDARI